MTAADPTPGALARGERILTLARELTAAAAQARRSGDWLDCNCASWSEYADRFPPVARFALRQSGGATVLILDDLTASDLAHLTHLRRGAEQRDADRRAALLAEMWTRPTIGAYRRDTRQVAA